MLQLANRGSVVKSFKNNIKKFSPILSTTSCLSLNGSVAQFESIISEELVIDSRQEFVCRAKTSERKRVNSLKAQSARRSNKVSLYCIISSESFLR